MNNFVTTITNFFKRPKSAQDVMLEHVEHIINRAIANDQQTCIIEITPSSVTEKEVPSTCASAVILYNNSDEFRKNVLYVESNLITNGHYCLMKMTDSVTNPFVYLYVYINELSTTLNKELI